MDNTLSGLYLIGFYVTFNAIYDAGNDSLGTSLFMGIVWPVIVICHMVTYIWDNTIGVLLE